MRQNHAELELCAPALMSTIAVRFLSKSTLYKLGTLCHAFSMLKKILPFFCLPLLLAGCSTPLVVTNLTPLQQVRTTNNLYTVEAAVASNQQTLRWQTIRPQIVVGREVYKMRPVLLMNNRWEGVLPVPSGVSEVHYRYQFDFEYNSWGSPGHDRVSTQDYTLKILEPAPER
jgi:hypothetical protein